MKNCHAFFCSRLISLLKCAGLFALVPFMLSSMVAHAQLDPSKLTQFDELKGNPVYDLLADSRGNIWVATQSGLVMFDGYDYTRYHPDLSDSTTMGELLTYVLHEDRRGRIWIGCQEAVFRYNPEYGSFTRFPLGDHIDFDEGNQLGVTNILDNHQGRIYFSVSSQIGWPGSRALFYYDEARDAMSSYDPGDSLDLISLVYAAKDPDDNFWLLDWSGFYKLDTLNRLHPIESEDMDYFWQGEYVSGITSDADGTIWFTTNRSRIFSYYPRENQIKLWDVHLPFEGEAFNTRTTLMPNDDGSIWITSQQGLLLFDHEKMVVEAFNPGSTDRILRDRYNALDRDDFGNLWIGAESVGLLMYNPRELLGSFVWDEHDPTTITTGWTVRMTEDSDGNIWVATRGIGVNTGVNLINLDKRTVVPHAYSEIDPDYNWDNIFGEIAPGKLLVQSGRDYSLFELGSMALKDTVISGISDSVSLNNIFRDSRGNLWFCSYSGLYLQPPGSSQKKHFNLMEQPHSIASSNYVMNVFESPNHGLWIITDQGLFLYDYETGEITRHGYDPMAGDTFTSQDINSFYEDQQGIAWVGTWQGGLSRYDPSTGSVRTYTIDDGLPSMSIQGILGDEKSGALWLSTFAGISRFSLDDEEFNNFSLQDGLQGLLYADGQYLKTSSGYFLFGGNNGITYFHPDLITENSMPPATYIVRFNVSDRAYPIGPDFDPGKPESPSFVLSHNENNVSIDYTGIQYDNPSKNRFSYILENYDETWREVNNQRSAYYYNLPPGNYTFKVKAANSHGVWNKEPATLSFQVSPPWWRTWWAYVLYGLTFLLGVFAVDRIQRKRLLAKQQRMAREKELAQAREIEKAYHQLKQTQSQLLHAEKMASLGELTAGIAHEIQNPLNFVNNFSEVNSELIGELKEELGKGNYNEVGAIAEDIAGNEEKISFHGRRADAIVKGMLQHSRSSNGQKERTNINALADEYLRLSYHGLRAKDKSFNAEFKLEADEKLPHVNVVPQDIGRVLLNLVNNAFYAVDKKAKQGAEGYKPEVIVNIRHTDKNVEIRVTDNGDGIPNDIKDKIFQPFFTTKPTGDGTGLGLSLSYDIITKGHGGNIRAETKEGEGSTFIIELPTTKT